MHGTDFCALTLFFSSCLSVPLWFYQTHYNFTGLFYVECSFFPTYYSCFIQYIQLKWQLVPGTLMIYFTLKYRDQSFLLRSLIFQWWWITGVGTYGESFSIFFTHRIYIWCGHYIHIYIWFYGVILFSLSFISLVFMIFFFFAHLLKGIEHLFFTFNYSLSCIWIFWVQLPILKCWLHIRRYLFPLSAEVIVVNIFNYTVLCDAG